MANRTTLAFELDDQTFQIEVKSLARARRLTLRVDPGLGQPRVVKPHHVSLADVRTFLKRNHGWLRQRLAKLPPAIPFMDGAEIPVRGIPHQLCHRPETRGTVWYDDQGHAPGQTPKLCIAGESAHLSRRVEDWLKKQARQDIHARVHHHAAKIAPIPGRITLRDTRSRWGSCAANGNLSFSWRLILAPENVLDYVVAHEVAHLVEHNHSARFWRLTARLCPEFETARQWLHRHGNHLHRYGHRPLRPTDRASLS